MRPGGVATMQTILLHPVALCALVFALLYAALEAGRFLGRRHAPGPGEAAGGAIDAAVFALLGLLIAFTFSGAASRFDHRRELIVQRRMRLARRGSASTPFPPPRNPRCATTFAPILPVGRRPMPSSPTPGPSMTPSPGPPGNRISYGRWRSKLGVGLTPSLRRTSCCCLRSMT